MPDSRSGAGGKILTNRRRQRLASTPYDRPPPPAPPKSPNWFTGVIIPSARALASGAGRLISSTIFSDSESSSSEDVDSASEDDIGNVNEFESPCDGLNELNEEKLTSPEMIQYGRESQFGMQRPETKRLVEQLIMQETFSMEECDRLINVLNSRVMDRSFEAGDKRSLVNSPGKTIDHEDPNILHKAVLEAKMWFQEKKGGLSSVAELSHGTCNLSSAAIDHRRNSLASGSWNIQEELRKVRSKAIDDMLRTPSAKNDSSLFTIASTRKEFTGAGKIVSDLGGEIFKPHSSWRTKPIDSLMDVGENAGPARLALESRQDCKAGEAPDASASGYNEDPETIQSDGEHALSKLSHPTSANHAEQQHSADPLSTKTSGPPATGAAEFDGRLHTSGFSSAQASSSPVAVITEYPKQYDEENHNDTASNDNRATNVTDMDGDCELLTDANMEVPNVTQTNSINSSSQISLDAQNEESQPQLAITQPSAEEKPHLSTRKQQGRKPGKNNRRTPRKR